MSANTDFTFSDTISADSAAVKVEVRPPRSGKELWKIVIDHFLNKEPPASHILKKLTPDGVIETVNKLQKDLNKITTENQAFYAFLQEYDPESLQDMEAAIKAEKAPPRRLSTLSKKKFTFAAIVKLAREHRKQPKLNISQKTELVFKCIDWSENKLEESKKKADNLKSKLMAGLEETTARKEELEASINNFENFKETHDTITWDKFANFMTTDLKESRLMADKIRLKYSTLRVQYRKLSATLANKKLIGENLHEIDFENLELANLGLKQKIGRVTDLLFALKRMTGNANLALSQCTHVLQKKISEKKEIEASIEKFEIMTGELDNEIYKLYKQLRKTKYEYKMVKERTDKFKAPQILEYIKVKVEADNLKQALKTWSQKKTSQEISLNLKIRQMKNFLHCKKIYPYWFD